MAFSRPFSGELLSRADPLSTLFFRSVDRVMSLALRLQEVF